MTDIAALKADVDRLERVLRDAKDALRAAQVERTGIPVGTIVHGTGRLAGKVFRVTGHKYFRDDGSCWLEGVQQRADGSFGTQVRHIYDDWKRSDE